MISQQSFYSFVYVDPIGQHRYIHVLYIDRSNGVMQFIVYLSQSAIEYNVRSMIRLDMQNIVTTYIESGLGFVSLEFGPSNDEYSPRLISFDVRLKDTGISKVKVAHGRIRMTPLSENVKLTDNVTRQAELDAMSVKQFTPTQPMYNIE